MILGLSLKGLRRLNGISLLTFFTLTKELDLGK